MAVIAPFGLSEYLWMPFSLKNAPGVFQRFVNSIFGDLSFVFVYIDDILVFSSNPNEHINHLKILFQCLDRFGLAINIEKCKFCAGELNFLGHKTSSKGFQPTDQRVEFFKMMQRPCTITGLRSVLGLWTFYRRFCKNSAELL